MPSHSREDPQGIASFPLSGERLHVHPLFQHSATSVILSERHPVPRLPCPGQDDREELLEPKESNGGISAGLTHARILWLYMVRSHSGPLSFRSFLAHLH